MQINTLSLKIFFPNRHGSVWQQQLFIFAVEQNTSKSEQEKNENKT